MCRLRDYTPAWPVIRAPWMDTLKIPLAVWNTPRLTTSPSGSGLVLPMMKELKQLNGSPPISGSHVGSCVLKKVYALLCSSKTKYTLDTCQKVFRKCFLNEIVSGTYGESLLSMLFIESEIRPTNPEYAQGCSPSRIASRS
ncbi:hypothetical protein VPH35_007506 [Triticum aestivum]